MMDRPQSGICRRSSGRPGTKDQGPRRLSVGNRLGPKKISQERRESEEGRTDLAEDYALHPYLLQGGPITRR